jgi:membrane protease YdiL (CAAX protease family)
MNPTALFSSAPAKGWLPWGVLAPFLLLAFVIAPVLATGDVLERMGLETARGDPVGLMGLYVFLLVPFAMTGALAFAWVLLVERRPLSTIGLTPSGAGAFLPGLAIGVATISVVVAAIWAAGGYRAEGFGRALSAPRDLIAIAILLLCFVVQASVEEIIFRGWLMSVLARRFNVAIAVIVTCIVFTLLHYGPGQQVNAIAAWFLFSAFACCWALKARNIWGVMGWHVGWNWFLATAFELPVTGIDAGVSALVVKLVPQGSDLLTGGAEGPEVSVICLLFFAAASAVLLWRISSEQPILAESSASVT